MMRCSQSTDFAIKGVQEYNLLCFEPADFDVSSQHPKFGCVILRTIRKMQKCSLTPQMDRYFTHVLLSLAHLLLIAREAYRA